jgi:NADH:ubiquinone oxidoreductase subunit 3 (subunit A)
MHTLLADQAATDYPFNHYAALGILLLMAIGFGVANVVLTTFLGPSRKGEVKGTTYESGMNPIGSARRRFNVRFYIVAMTFLLFDVGGHLSFVGRQRKRLSSFSFPRTHVILCSHDCDRFRLCMAQGRIQVRLIQDTVCVYAAPTSLNPGSGTERSARVVLHGAGDFGMTRATLDALNG